MFRRRAAPPSADDFDRLEAFFKICTLGSAERLTFKGLPYAPTWLRDEQHKLFANDPRVQLASMIVREVDAQKVDEVRALTGPAAKKLVAIANAAMMDDNAFRKYVRKQSKKNAKELRDFRQDWLQAVEKISTTKAKVERFQELSEIWSQERYIDLDAGGIVQFVQGLTPEEWHVFICDILWDSDDDPGVFDAAAWIVQQDACDGSTAGAFLVSAHVGAICSDSLGYLDIERARALTSDVRARLEQGAYSTMSFALPKTVASWLDRFESELRESAPHVPWSQLKDTGLRTASADFFLIENKLAITFERWLDETGRALK